MSPIETKDLEVRTLGLCNVCGQEQLLRTRAFISSEGGVQLDVRQFTDCACGPKAYKPNNTGERMTDDEVHAILTQLYNAHELPCDEGPLRISSDFDTDQIIIRGQTSRDYSVRFKEDRFLDLVGESRVPVTVQLIRSLLCFLYHRPERYRWVRKVRAKR